MVDFNFLHFSVFCFSINRTFKNFYQKNNY